MKKQTQGRNRRGVAGRSVGFSLFILIGMSTFLGFVAQIALTKTSLAANGQTGYWQNISLIRINQQYFIDTKLDPDLTFQRRDDADGCPDKIYDVSNFADKTAKYLVITKDSSGDCKNSPVKDIDLKNETSHSNLIALNWVDANKINRVYGTSSQNFVYDSKDKLYYQNENNGDGCKDTISVTKQPKPTDELSIDYAAYTQATLIVREKRGVLNYDEGSMARKALRENYSHYPFHDDIDYDTAIKSSGSNTTCLRSKPVTIYLGNTPDSHNFNGTKATNGDHTSDDDEQATDDAAGTDDPNKANCQIQGALGWVLNPVCDIAIESTAKLGDFITKGLQVEPLSQSSGSELNGTYEAWRVFRDLANAFLVLIFLIAIFAQVLPIEVDSYTVKKTLPKLIAAAIGIQLSYFMCQIMVDISNVLGGGVTGMIQSVIDRLPALVNSSTATDQASSFATYAFIGIAGVTVGVAFIGPVVLLLIGAIASILTMLITIQARQIILIFLAIASPLALLAWVLPNTESYAKKWAQNYIKLLLMYPLIAFILAGAELIYVIMSNATTTSSTSTSLSSVQQVMVNFIPVIAFFMIPATFKASGTLMGAINGAVGNKLGSARGKAAGSDLYKNFRSGQKEKALIQMGDRSGLRRLTAKVRAGETLGGFGKVGKRQLDAKITAARQQQNKALGAGFEENGYGNPDIGAIADAYMEGNGTATLADGRKVKGIDDKMGQAAIAYLAANGGDKEIGDLAKKVYNKDTLVPDGKGGFKFDPKAKGAGGKYDKLNRGLILSGAKGKQAKSNPQLVKGAGAFGDGATVDVIKGLKGPTGEIGAQVAFGTTEAAARRNISNILSITSDRDAAREIDSRTAIAYKKEALDYLERTGKEDMLLDDGSGRTVKEHIESTITDDGAVLANPDNVVQADWEGRGGPPPPSPGSGPSFDPGPGTDPVV